MKQFWLDSVECTGCGACACACPVNAIAMEEDGSGFIYPRIAEACIDCNACERVCKARAHCSGESFRQSVYACWSMDEKVRFESTSGGAFTELARAILREGGLVCGAVYSNVAHVIHELVSDEEGLDRVRQSKYLQSDSGVAFRDVKAALDGGKSVLFCGAPCQVAGLKAFLKKDYSALVTVDFICRGVNSPKAYRSWLDEVERRVGARARRVWFKYKVGGWKSSPRRTLIQFDDGRETVYDQDGNLFMEAYLGPNLFIRPSCGSCLFKGSSRVSDITLGDFWGIDTALDDDKGTSMVLVNSERGRRLFAQSASRLVVHERNLEEMMAGNRCFDFSVEINRDSKKVLGQLGSKAFSKVVKPYLKKPLSKRMKSAMRKVLLPLG